MTVTGLGPSLLTREMREPVTTTDGKGASFASLTALASLGSLAGLASWAGAVAGTWA